MIQKLIKNSVVMEAVQLLKTNTSILEVEQFLNGREDIGQTDNLGSVMFYDYCKYLIEKGGRDLEVCGKTQFIYFGDWVIKGVTGEFFICSPDIYEKNYAPLAPIEGEDELWEEAIGIIRENLITGCPTKEIVSQLSFTIKRKSWHKNSEKNQ